MIPTVRRALATTVAVAAVVAIGALSRAPYTAERETRAVIRLAWRARGERAEECRRLTPQELKRLPPHMRREEECAGGVLPYRLRVTLDGARAVDELVHAAGARHDRPLYVFQELALEPGSHTVLVTFVPEGEIPARARADKENKEAEQEEAAPAPTLVLDTTVTLAVRRVLLVTYDEEGRRLVVKDAAAR